MTFSFFRWWPYWILCTLATSGLPQHVCGGFKKPYVHTFDHAKFHKLVTKCTIFPNSLPANKALVKSMTHLRHDYEMVRHT